MKYLYKKIVLVLLIITSMASCELDRYNPSGLTGDGLFDKMEKLNELVVDCYYPLNRSLFNKWDYLVTAEMGTDLWITANQRSFADQYSYYDNLNSTVNHVNKVWEFAYSRINTCNLAIQNATIVKDATTDQVNEKVAEAYCLRAYYYSILVEQYGEVFLTTTPNSTPNLTPKRSTVAYIYAQMVSDLKFAEQHLPVVNKEGFVTKKTAKGLLAKVYLQGTAYDLKDVDTNKSYAECAKKTAEELIDNMEVYNAYLYPNFSDVFTDANNRKNKEALFISPGAEYGTSAGTNSSTNNVFRMFLPRVGYYTDLGVNLIEKGMIYGRANDWAYQPSKYLLDVFSEKDKRFYETFITTFSSYSRIEKGQLPQDCGATLTKDLCDKYGIDPAFIGRFIKPAFDYNDNNREIKYFDNRNVLQIITDPLVLERKETLPEDVDNIAIYISKKPLTAQEKARRPYFCVNIDELYDSNGEVMSSKNIYSQISPLFRKYIWSHPSLTQDYQNKRGDVFIMRMAEVYLIAAEANILLGNNQKSADQINVLRKRACDPSDYVVGNMKVSPEKMNIDFILDERARELCGEYSRWYDLKRTKKIEDRLGKYNMKASKNFDPQKHYLRPISQNFLNLIENGEEFGQNPGY